MARWIRSDGTEQEVYPAGTEFTTDELHQCIPGMLNSFALTDTQQGRLFLFLDDEALVKGLPFNRVATELLHAYRPNWHHLRICGDVVVASREETGEDQP